LENDLAIGERVNGAADPKDLDPPERRAAGGDLKRGGQEFLAVLALGACIGDIDPDQVDCLLGDPQTTQCSGES